MAQKGTKFRKSKRMCIVCGKEFEGVASANTCGGGCRIRLARLKEANRKPEYLLIAKSRGQKIPDLNAPKRPKLEKGETLALRFNPPAKKEQKAEGIEIFKDKIDFAETTVESYDGAIISATVIDEVGMAAFVTPLTWEQKVTHNEEIDRQIKAVDKLIMPPGTFIRTWALTKQGMKSDLEAKKYPL